jgi:hypothetical protein
MSARQQQVGGSHYRDMDIQPWDAMRAWMTPAEFRGFLRGNAIKYLARCDKKGAPVEDLRKARHYIDKLIELEISSPLAEAMGAPQTPEWLDQVHAREAARRGTSFLPQEVPRD